MASSNRHWPSMFKSKPCNSHHQWQHDTNPSLMSSCQRSPYTSGCEERTPEPKPRWNPKPEQIRILEAIFNSGMVNPPRDEIRRIRAQLQEFGQVGDANVFYWFQNRKSRSKHKQRHIHNVKPQQQTQSSQLVATTTTTTTVAAPSSSSSSSSDRTSPKRTDKSLAMSGFNLIDVSNSPTVSVNQQQQPFFQTHGDFSSEPFLFPVQQHSGSTNAMYSQGFGFPDLTNVIQSPDHTITTGNFLTELLLMDQEASKREEEENVKLQQQLSYTIPSNTTTSTTNVATPTTSNVNIITSTTSNTPLTFINPLQVVGEQGAPAKSTVFINDQAFDVPVGPFNVREAFGDDVVLINSSCQPVPVNDSGVTLQSLTPGAFYYLARVPNVFDYLTS